MIYSSSLADNLMPLVLDTSVLINLHASKLGREILDALPNTVVLPLIVATELENETSKKNGEYQFIQNLLASKTVSPTALREHENDIFKSLVSGNDSLDDGEAATIAIAASRGFLPILDERKGRKKAQAHIPEREPGWSLDLFRHPKAMTKLGPALSIDALYYALRDGRMRIHESHCDHVVSLIGVQRALECKSLPGYKARRERWERT